MTDSFRQMVELLCNSSIFRSVWFRYDGHLDYPIVCHDYIECIEFMFEFKIFRYG